MTTWTKAVDTLLPRASWVSLVELSSDGDDGSVVMVPWNAITDRLMSVAGLHPPRFRTGAFPDVRTLKSLRARYK